MPFPMKHEMGVPVLTRLRWWRPLAGPCQTGIGPGGRVRHQAHASPGSNPGKEAFTSATSAG